MNHYTLPASEGWDRRIPEAESDRHHRHYERVFKEIEEKLLILATTTKIEYRKRSADLMFEHGKLKEKLIGTLKILRDSELLIEEDYDFFLNRFQVHVHSLLYFTNKLNSVIYDSNKDYVL
ncbi:MAG: hypothetical protein GY739_21690 [Mesoflavibacter sp.]|nr:hypothetical protein [Mesoflavibacter sp.]